MVAVKKVKSAGLSVTEIETSANKVPESVAGMAEEKLNHLNQPAVQLTPPLPCLEYRVTPMASIFGLLSRQEVMGKQVQHLSPLLPCSI
jgi:hypothetical protein